MELGEQESAEDQAEVLVPVLEKKGWPWAPMPSGTVPGLCSGMQGLCCTWGTQPHSQLLHLLHCQLINCLFSPSSSA